jgi:transcriptional regulator with XRE-family HTH domain
VRRQDADTAIRTIGRRIAYLRRERALTQERFAEEVGVSEKYVQRVEAGANLSVRSLVKFANALDVPLTALVAPPRRPRGG